METRIATFLFEDIYLADSFVNEPASHGFVKYRIIANDGLSEATEINNTANIFFDSNPAIVTNTIASTMVSELPALPVISATPQALDFGVVMYGETGTQTLVIQNPGDLDLEITEINIESPVFTTAVTNFVVEGGGDKAIEVEFFPIDAINYTSNLTLVSNVGDLMISLKGESVALGINDLDLRLSIVPNPSNGIFNLNWTGDNALEQGTLKVFSVNGQTILSQPTSGNQTRIDLRGQAKGVYYLSIETENTTIIQKLIVQ